MKMPQFNGNNDSHSKVDKEAANWVLRRDRGLTAAEQDALTDWLAADPVHREAYSLQRWGWDELDRIAGMHKVHATPANEDLLRWNLSASQRLRRLSPWVLPVLAIAACVVLTLGGFLKTSRPEETLTPAGSAIVYERIQKLQLDDGSEIELNHGSRLRTAYTESERAIHLHEGEANFKVANDPNRPFVVYVSGVRFCALGTIFNVRYNTESVDLIVTEGRVQVLDNMSDQVPFDEEAIHAPIVEMSQRAIIRLDKARRDMTVRQLAPDEIEQELLWRPELIDFDDEFLPVIVNEFNRRNRVQIYLNNPKLRRLKLTSIFWSDNVEAFVRLLESSFDVTVERHNEFEIYLSVDS